MTLHPINCLNQKPEVYPWFFPLCVPHMDSIRKTCDFHSCILTLSTSIVTARSSAPTIYLGSGNNLSISTTAPSSLFGGSQLAWYLRSVNQILPSPNWKLISGFLSPWEQHPDPKQWPDRPRAAWPLGPSQMALPDGRSLPPHSAATLTSSGSSVHQALFCLGVFPTLITRWLFSSFWN